MHEPRARPPIDGAAQFRVTFITPAEALSIHIGPLDPEARAHVIAACVRLGLMSGWRVRIQRLRKSP